MFLPWIFIALTSYLLGSFPTGYLAGRYRGIDLRTKGSGNIGATNALRILGKHWAYLVLTIDFAKGLLATLLANHWSLEHNIYPASSPGALAALCVLLGNSFPIWLRFRGGKGIASSAGVIVGLFPTAFLFVIGIWLLVVTLTRIVSVASIVSSIALPVAVGLLYFLHKADWLSLLLSVLMCLLALWQHRGNIVRLRSGTEPSFKKKNSTASL